MVPIALLFSLVSFWTVSPPTSPTCIPATNPGIHASVLTTQSGSSPVGSKRGTLNVTISNHTQVLSWNDLFESQDATFDCTCTVNFPNLVVDSYQWEDDNHNDFTPAWATTPTPGLNKVSVHVPFPQQIHVTCRVLGHYTGDAPGPFEGGDSDYAVAYGGPISFQPDFGTLKTRWNDFTKIGSTDSSEPAYAQFFGLEVTTDPTLQLPQGVIVYNALSQNANTYITWNTGSLVAPRFTSTTQVPPSAVIPLSATTSGLQTVSCTYYITWQNPKDSQIYNASGPDDTSQTLAPPGSQNEYLSNQVDVHMPTAINPLASVGAPWLPDNFPDATGWLTNYWLGLTDQYSQTMGSVWFNEHYTSPIPPNFSINSDQLYWTSDWTCPKWPGNQIDHIGYWWGDASTAVAYFPVHQYWAGTHPSKGVEGLLCGTYQISLIPGSIQDSPTPAQATQTRSN